MKGMQALATPALQYLTAQSCSEMAGTYSKHKHRPVNVIDNSEDCIDFPGYGNLGGQPIMHIPGTMMDQPMGMTPWGYGCVGSPVAYPTFMPQPNYYY